MTTDDQRSSSRANDHDVELLVLELLAECRERGISRPLAIASIWRALRALA